MAADALAPDAAVTLDLADIQGIILRGYRLPKVRYFVLEVADRAPARKLLGALASGSAACPQITTAQPWNESQPPNYCCNLGLTWPGLQALGLTDASFGSFRAFREGAAARAELLGDTGRSAPDQWTAGLGSGRDHVLLALYAATSLDIDTQTTRLRAAFAAGPALTELAAFDASALPGGVVHFGYRDGLTQPTVLGAGYRPLPDAQPPVEAWQFVLQDAPDASYKVPEPHELGLNGSFAVFRILRQDVVGFERFLQSHSHEIDPELLAAKLCGRWRNGTPLALSPDSPTGVGEEHLSRFDYRKTKLAPDAVDDADGARCPLGSHVRRSNPRSTPVEGGGGQLHRVIRRGMPYGPPYDPSQPDDGVERGLAGFFINASIENQYEFIVRRWMNRGGFAAGLPHSCKDPLGDNDGNSGHFQIPRADKPPLEIRGFGRFVEARGGAYCFLPSITALRYIASYIGP
jgi:deferrochelatase/peroxidase EfeB